MDEQERVEILTEILEERLPHVQRMVEEWSVSNADALSYAQSKDLIWQLMAPLGMTLVGYKAAERTLQDDPGDIDVQQAMQRFTQVGADVGELLDQFLHTANHVR